jgi:regulatory protein
MKIIKIAKKGMNNVEIHFDDGNALILSYEIFLKNGLRKNDEVSESHFSFLKSENEKYMIKQKSYNYLARRLHSEKELRLKLLKNRYNTDLIDEALDELKKLNYLDDEKFAYEFVEEKSKRGWGKNKIKAALISRGLQSKIINKVLDEEIDNALEYEKAFELANKKLRILSGRNFEVIKLKQKINAFLVSKGFDFDVIREVVDKLKLQKDDG